MIDPHDLPKILLVVVAGIVTGISSACGSGFFGSCSIILIGFLLIGSVAGILLRKGGDVLKDSIWVGGVATVFAIIVRLLMLI